MASHHRKVGLRSATLGALVALCTILRADAFWHGVNRIDLTNYSIVWSDEFDGPLDVSSIGPGTKWFHHKPDFQDFAGVGWGDVFSTSGGILTIAAKTVGGVWHAGILSSVSATGEGVAWQNGYFEWRMRFPPPGGHTAPVAWMLAKCHIPFPGTCPDVEIDVVEQFGNFFPDKLNFTYHYWIDPPEGTQYGKIVGDMWTDFHTYGLLLDDDWIVFFFDRQEIGRQVRLPESKTPLFVLVNLGLSGDPALWGEGTTDPSLLLVDYVRVYQRN